MSDDGRVDLAEAWDGLAAALRTERDRLIGPLADWLSRHLPKPR